MNVEYFLRKLLHKPGREQAHVASQADEIDFMVFQCGDHFAIMGLAVFPFRGDSQSVEAQFSGGFQSTSVRFIRNDDSYASVEDRATRDVSCYRTKIGATPGKQNAYVLHEYEIIIGRS